MTCAGPKCTATDGRDSHQWTTCHSCTASPVRLCPKCVHRHFETHDKRPVRCWLVPQETSS